MRYLNVFLIWLWANMILIISAFILINLHYYLKDGIIGKDIGLYQNIGITILIGFLLTVPSLILMLSFHFLYSKNKSDVKDYLKPYCILILSINLLYLIPYKMIFGLERLWGGHITLPMIFFLTNAAGLVGLYIEQKKIRKRVVN